MFKLSVCVLTHNSERLLADVLQALLPVADECIIVDSGSSDNTLNICRQFGIEAIYHPFSMHGQQMNVAISRARHDWVLCLDSDEILDAATCDYILRLKQGDAPDADCAWRLTRQWYVLGEAVRTLYPVSSPDFPARLFNRHCAHFNDRPVDDEVVGFRRSHIIPGAVRHDTFYSLHEMFNKLNAYTTRLVTYKTIRPSLSRGAFSAIGSFFKWYLFSGAFRQGRVGAATGLYATLYSFLKYYKAWHARRR
ncbi:glycosyltransferase family 2 protein [Pantoea sp. 1.19]|uniref:glycosyltransferase family 2 protein n=1 Tax=Pantoea sp. 1.19 TaxID=1925589 RepID=UPI000948F0CF|nr:glycosyltransferase family 2 protein [Pantoea sp. 1.19]